MKLQEETSARDSAARALWLLGWSAWAMLGWVILGFVSSVPDVQAKLSAVETVPVARFALGSILLLVFLTALALWIAAIWHVAKYPRTSSTSRVLLIAALIFFNFVGGFFYYFLYAWWLPSSTQLHEEVDAP